MNNLGTNSIIDTIIENIWIQRLFWSCLIVVGAIIIYFLITRFISAKEKKRSKIFDNKKNKTYLRMLKSIAGYVIIVITVLMILQVFGVDTSSMLAGVGIIGIVIGFAIQDALKDIIKGFDILSDDYYNVGDIVKYGNNTGKVISVGLKTTKMQDILTGNMVSISNRNIDTAEIVSGEIYLNIPLPYELPVTKAEDLLTAAMAKVKNNEEVTEADFLGLNKLEDSSKDYLVKVVCDPTAKLRVRRYALRTIIAHLEEQKISIPYPQLDVHTKK